MRSCHRVNAHAMTSPPVKNGTTAATYATSFHALPATLGA